MKTAPLHFKINYLATERQELINDGNKFGMEIYVLVTQSRAMGMLKWGGEIRNVKQYLYPKKTLSQMVVESTGGHLCLRCPTMVETWPPPRDQARSQGLLLGNAF